ncbi:TraM recognition domain-containing protein [Actinotalea sp. K2]|uniref:TraM recognition domain-containing protein n=1 Tax=Actinotalea sp. K2 TaxID=2939438 RepID=UPI002017C9F0|nr:TraM recognition domain-containing protein [Actinotalea sp. K2]MCL3863031.1 TraM recognition domain-containing protein [Actinotalea sp. K2]
MSVTALAQHRPYRPLSTSLLILLAWVGLVGIVIGLLLHVAAAGTATLTGNNVPGLRETLEAFRSSPTHPVAGYADAVGPAPVVYALTGVMVTGLGVGGFWVAMILGRRALDSRTGRTTPKHLSAIHAGPALERAHQVMGPAGGSHSTEELCVPVGTLRGVDLYGQHEDSYCLIAPARSGKTMCLAVGWVLGAPGPVVATGTKNDLLFLTATMRRGAGTVQAMDPAEVAGWPDRLRWNPVRGCQDPDEALERGRAWAAGDPGRSGGKNSEWFNARAGEVLAYFLHAAALKPGGSMRDVMRWAADFEDEEPIRLLTESPYAEQVGWADLLKARTRSRAGETTDSLRMTLSGLLAPLTSPRVLEAVCPVAEDEFDVAQFLSGPNTIYLLSGRGAGNVAPLLTMLTDHIVRAAQRLSQHQPGGRLWPPLRLVLDEAANVAPLPDLPALMSDSGGRGITTMVICQSFAQMDDLWGREGAEALRANATVTMYLPGIKEVDRLRALSEATGRYRAKRVSYSSGQDRGSVSTSSEWENVMTTDDIRTMPVGTGLLFYRGLKAAHVTFTPWWERPDSKTIEAGKAGVEELTGRAMQ